MGVRIDAWNGMQALRFSLLGCLQVGSHPAVTNGDVLGMVCHLHMAEWHAHVPNDLHHRCGCHDCTQMAEETQQARVSM